MPNPDDESASPDAEHTARLAWFTKVRNLHRNKRMVGFAGIVAGAGAVVWWKLDGNAPDWALWAGIGVLSVSWLLFIYVIIARYQWVKKNPYRATT